MSLRSIQKVQIPNEFAFIAACCRWPLTADALADVQQRAERTLDWDFVARLAERHRVVGLVHHALHAAAVPVPGDVGGELAAKSQIIARQNLALAAETVRLQQRFDAAGIPLLT